VGGRRHVHVLLALLWSLGDLGRGGAGVLLGWFLLAVYFQFLGASALLRAAGLVLQTVLAICLLIRWKASGSWRLADASGCRARPRLRYA